MFSADFPDPVAKVCVQRFERERGANVCTRAFLVIRQIARGASVTSQIPNSSMEARIPIYAAIEAASPAASSDIPQKLSELVLGFMVYVPEQMQTGKSRAQVFVLLKV